MGNQTKEVEYLEAIVRPLINNPIQIERKTDERGVLLTIKLEQEDIGRVIGRGGETARAIRKLIKNYGMSHEMQIAVKIHEPQKENQEESDDLKL